MTIIDSLLICNLFLSGKVQENLSVFSQAGHEVAESDTNSVRHNLAPS
jgi:hypothetical protein